MPESQETEILHANQLRGAEFRKLIRRPVSWVTIGIVSLLALGVFLAMDLAVVGLIALVVTAAVGILIVFLIADSRAEDTFFNAYCASHGLTRISKPDLAPLTPLLRKGDKRRTEEMFHGQLADGIEGDLVLYTYTEEYRDSKGNTNETDYPFTLVHVELPEVVRHLPELRVQNKSGFKFLEGFEDKFRLNHERVTLESEAMRDRYEIFVLKDQDQIWVRRFFSPSFIVWLVENPPKSFAFELEDGHLIAYVPKHGDNVAALEEVSRVGSHIARRLIEEVAQTSPREERELNG